MMAWDACTLEPFAPLRWMECHPGFAGYVQAVGTIAAVLAAIYAPMIADWVSRRRIAGERRATTRNFIAALRPAIVDTYTTADRVARQIDARKGQRPQAHLWRDLFDRDFVLRPDPALEFPQQWPTELDETMIEPYRKLALAIRSYNSVRSQIGLQAIPADDDTWRQLCGALERSLMEVRNEAFLAN